MPFTSPTSATPLPQILGYLLVEEIYVGDLTAVYRAIAQSDNRSAIVTILRSDSPPCDDLLQFRHQYTIVKNLNLSGVALLELLTGELPFQADAPGELIQAQIVRSPALVSVLNPDVPDMVAAIVAKLVAKNPEDRYQTALGLQHDLNICIDRWSATGKIDRFELGLPDLSDQLSIDCLNQSKSDLIAAERCRVLGDRLNAIELYDRSISGAIADADLQQAATSNELAARFYLGWGKEKIATVYLQEAYAYFARCGAISKTEDLKNCYPHFLAPISPPQQPFDRLSHPTAIVDPAQSYLSASASAELQPQVRGSSYVDLAAVWEFDQVLANNIPGVIYKFRVDTNEQISFPYISSGCQELFHLSPAEVMADSACLMSLIHPDDFLVLLQIISESAVNLTSKLWEGRFTLDSGEVKWIKSASRPEPQPDGSIVWDGVLLNISDLKQAELNLAASQQQYYRLIQSIPGVVWEYDLELDKFTFVSDRAEALLGYPVEAWLSQPDFWRRHVYAADLDHTIQIYDNALRNRQNCEFEYRLVTADDRLVWVYDISTPVFDRHGKLVATTGLLIDITDRQAALFNRQQAELALQQTNERLASTNQELLRVTQLKDEFLATMSHELRTPLNAILGMSECLQAEIFGSINERQAKSIATIERSGQHLLSLINDILDVSKIAAGKLELEIVEVSIANLCKSSLTFVKQQAERKQIQLQLQLQNQLGKISVDRRRMTQVAINLLANAVKFTPQGGSVTLSAGIATPDLTQSTQGDWIRLAVIDTGIGISPTDRERLFQPFIQVDSNLNRQYEGTGLGLALVKQIVELHGGYVTLESELGQGSCFSVYLPYTGTKEDLLTDPHTSEKPESHADELEQTIGAASTILLAEDNKANAITFVSYFNSKGYRTILANNGIEAIELAKTEHPHLILMDIQMPGMDGIEAIEQIRQHLELAQTPIIALTALAMETDLPAGVLSNREKCLAAGANEYITKPVKLKDLNSRIQHYLKFSDGS
jgi:PAS domain S-box-containing protein